MGMCVLFSAAGWWAGSIPGAIWSVLVASGLLLARRSARRRGAPLASVPLWEVALVPVVSVPIGIGLGVLVFILGPGF